MLGAVVGFGFCVVGLVSLIWTRWFWRVFGFGFGVLGLVEGCWFKCCGFTFAGLVGWWVMFGWVVLFVIAF